MTLRSGLQKVSVDQIVYDDDLMDELITERAQLVDGATYPLILESNGTLWDGYHRLGGLLAAGETEITVIVLSHEESAIFYDLIYPDRRIYASEEVFFRHIWDKYGY